MTVKARVVQPSKLFRIARWYDVIGATAIKQRGELTVTFVHLSNDGNTVYLNGMSADSWSYAEAAKMPYEWKPPLVVEIRCLTEPHSDVPIRIVKVSYAKPHQWDQLGRFHVEVITQ